MKTVLLSAVGLLLASCGTILWGPNQDVEFDSHPKGAQMEMGEYNCTSVPCSITVPRRISAVATFKLEGCEDKKVIVSGKFSNLGYAFAAGSVMYGAATVEFLDLAEGNISGVIALIGGVAVLTVDLITGSLNEVKPDPVVANMDCSPT